jgi:acyl phosphate:glycerol-3-phosphate acyltransferase
MIAFFIAYIVGAIPSGYLFSKYLFNVDVTKYGSGNIGATNVARVLGSKKYFFIIFTFDFLKAYLTLFFIAHYCPSTILFIAAICLIVGNGYSIFLKFRGGKGVSTGAGILLFFFPLLFFIMLGVWVILLLIFRRVDVASLGALGGLIPIYLFLEYFSDSDFLFLLFLIAWIVVRHRSNIALFFNRERA